MTVLRTLVRICRRSMDSNSWLSWRTFSRSDNAGLAAIRSIGRSAARTARSRGFTFISADDQLSLKRASLFHGLKDGHDIARRDAEGIQGGGDFFHRGQFR